MRILFNATCFFGILSICLSLSACQNRHSPEYIYGHIYNSQRDSLCVPRIERTMRLNYFRDANNFLFSYGRPLDLSSNGYHSAKWIKIKERKIYEEEDTYYASMNEKEGRVLYITYNHFNSTFQASTKMAYRDSVNTKGPIEVSLAQADSILASWGLSRCPAQQSMRD